MNLLNEIKALFNKVEAKFADYKTTEGLILRVEALEVGQLVQIMDENGTLTNATAGEYALEDGQELIVGEDGTISEITDNTQEEDAAEGETVEVTASEIEVEAAEEVPTEAPAIDLEPRIAQLEEAVMLLAEKVNALESEKAAVEAEMSAIKEENEGLKNTTPAAEPVKFKKLNPEIKSEKTINKYSSLFENKQ